MTSERLGDVFEGDSADTCAENFPLTLIRGPSRGSHMRRPGSDDPHRRDWKFGNLINRREKMGVGAI